MPKSIEEMLSGDGKRFTLVVSRFNSFITERLVEGALDCLYRHAVADDDIEVCRVPGAWEIPLVARRVAETRRFDADLCLGAVIRGSTPHFDYVAAEASKGVTHVGLETGIPTVFGVLTTDTIEQALERAGTKAGNKGWEAALTGIEMGFLLSQVQGAST